MDIQKQPRRVWVLAALAVVVLIGIDLGLSAPSSFPKEQDIFTIASGQGLKSVATELQAAHYVRSSVLFSTLVTLLGGEHRIAPGDYHFSMGESAFGIANQIARANHNLVPIKVTIPEGENVTEVAALLAEKIPNFDTKAFIAEATHQEGYLFPETYFVYASTSPADIVTEMRAMFDSKTASLFANQATNGHTNAEIVTMASLVEREAHGDDDRATIAGILWKRIGLGMRLEVDSTVAFASGVSDSALSKKDFSIVSPYNTYTHAGLPPDPIASPGLEALKAAMYPTVTPYLYYLHDKHGTIHYAKTYAEHQANIAKYLK